MAAGWKPGCSTDYDAVLLAKAYGAKKLVNLTNFLKETGLPVTVAPNPLLAVCMGTGKALPFIDRFKRKKRG